MRLYFRRTRILPCYLAPVFFLEAGRVVGFFSYSLLSWSCAGAGGLRCRTRPPQKFFESVEGMKPLTVAILRDSAFPFWARFCNRREVSGGLIGRREKIFCARHFWSAKILCNLRRYPAGWFICWLSVMCCFFACPCRRSLPASSPPRARLQNRAKNLLKAYASLWGACTVEL